MRFGGLVRVPSRRQSWTFLLVGVGLLAGSLVSAIHTSAFMRRSMTAQGTVLHLNPKPNSDNDGTVYAPVFSFTAIDGQSYTLSSNNYSSPPEFSEGQTVKVLYERGSPSEARIDSVWQLWATEVVLGVIGSLFAAFSVGFLTFLRWRDQQALARP